MASWGAQLLKYKQDKLKTPWDTVGGPAAILQPHVKWSELSQKQRAFNPVLQCHVSTSGERRLRDAEIHKEKKRAQNAIEKRLKHTYVSYDVVSNEVKYPSKESPPKKEFIIADTRTDYNILNFQEHFNKKKWNQFTKARVADAGKKTDFPADITYAKDFDIVSTKYKEHHAKRVRAHHQKTLKEKQEEFHRRNKYNPIRGIFHDKAKEIAYRHRRKDFMEQHSQNPKPKPQSLEDADGALFNIITQDVYDKEGLRKKEAFDNRSVETRKQKIIFEMGVKKRQSEEYELNLSRKLNRISFKRLEDIRSRGYDPITNEPFTGVGAKVLAPSQQKRRMSDWERVQYAAQSNVLSNNDQARRARSQSAGKEALRSTLKQGNSMNRSTTRNFNMQKGNGEGQRRMPTIPKERRMSTNRPRGQTGRVNIAR